ncbi:MAG: single-stranded-DNA-specific exonuclease RecJ [Candidatus Latescibacteria bacterium]|jgi:single-stranded-DNA-specific exonuclease|nr:single-stranded-DNA-specific exonuclease RecJ [Candidatus Latescibacterota bacterium]
MIEKKTKWCLPSSEIEKISGMLMRERPMPLHFARILALRGITSIDDADAFVNPSLDDLRDPFLMKDMDKAVERLKSAMRKGERMMILGDYDVDGVCGTALFIRVMTNLGVKVGYHVPDRFKEGYGVSEESIDRAIRFGAKLVVSVDSGITALKEIEYARSKGIDVIITDHHEPQSGLPNALAVVDPKRNDSTYPFRELAGVGVMFKLLQAVYADMEMDFGELFEELDLVALGTAADVVPLVDENRILTRFGIERMKNTANTGLAALMEISGASKIKANSSNIIFSLAPRLNAPGRLSSASKTVELLISNNWLEAIKIAEEIEEENAERRKMNDSVYVEAESMLKNEETDKHISGIILASESWHQGVIGIAASRLVEKYYLPTILISLEGGVGKGSARSIKEFDIITAMSQCEDILKNYGGHKYAVGLSIQADKIDQFRERFIGIINRELPDGIPVSSFAIDSEVDLSYVNETMIRFLDELAPFGENNPMPLLLTRNLRPINNARIVGKNHLKFKVTDGTKIFNSIAYNMGEYKSRVRVDAPPIDILYSVEENLWMGRKSIQLVVKAIE